jgi:hypothetical protein
MTTATQMHTDPGRHAAMAFHHADPRAFDLTLVVGPFSFAGREPVVIEARHDLEIRVTRGALSAAAGSTGTRQRAGTGGRIAIARGDRCVVTPHPRTQVELRRS